MNDLDEQQEEQQTEQEQSQGDEAAAEQSQAAHDAQADDSAAAESANDEVVIGFGDEPAPAANEDEIEGKPAPAWVRELRKQAREKDKRIRELEQAATAHAAASAPKEDPVGEKPTLESCDYDADKLVDETLAWKDRKDKADAKAKAALQEQEAQQAEHTKKLADYRAAATALRVDGFEDAEATVVAALNPLQQNILLDGPKTAQVSAQLVAALGRNPAKLKELADIKNPVKYAFAVADLVGQLKVQTKKQPPAAERAVRGSAGGATAVDNIEAKLEREADESGNRTKLIQYRKQKAAKAAQAA